MDKATPDRPHDPEEQGTDETHRDRFVDNISWPARVRHTWTGVRPLIFGIGGKDRQKSLPLWGRWLAEGQTDEVSAIGGDGFDHFRASRKEPGK